MALLASMNLRETLEWRSDQAGCWSGWVAYVVDDGGQAIKVSAWVPAEHLRPA